jgi:hypothetical protein
MVVAVVGRQAAAQEAGERERERESAVAPWSVF